MSDTETIPTAADAAKKKMVSKRVVLNAQGVEQDDWIDAYGFSYTSLAENFELAVKFDELPDEVVRALAAFGGLTLAGNTTNTVRNGDNKGAAATEKEALVAWLENLKAGNWTSPRGEVEAGLGSLAEAYVAAMAKEGATLELDATLGKLKEADKDKRKAIRTDPRVKAELTRIIAERAATKAAAAAGPIAAL